MIPFIHIIITYFIIIGPLHAYNALVEKKKIRDDKFQRVALAKLQELHDNLKNYNPPLPVGPLDAAKETVYYYNTYYY